MESPIAKFLWTVGASLVLSILLYAGVPRSARLWNRSYRLSLIQHLLCLTAALVFLGASLAWAGTGLVGDTGDYLQELLSRGLENGRHSDSGGVVKAIEEVVLSLLADMVSEFKWFSGWASGIRTWAFLIGFSVQIIAYTIVNIAAYRDLER